MKLRPAGEIFREVGQSHRYFNNTSKPYIRWWWMAGAIRRLDIAEQLDWLKSKGFGGVEIAWVWPSWVPSSFESDAGPEWLSDEWSELVAFAKSHADKLGMGCDFTFGTAWPFGGSYVKPEHAMQTLDGFSDDRVTLSWESPYEELRVLDHLNRQAFDAYAQKLLPAFEKALSGSPSAFFCDSFELERDGIWSQHLWKKFKQRFGYRLQRFVAALQTIPHVRYDYRRLAADSFVEEFLEPFSAMCHAHGASSRVQCHGALSDLLAAYAAVDIPESEALLFEPHFSRIPASAAALADKPIVSAETFTCIYGFEVSPVPRPHRFWRQEQVGDLKLLADALFANGVNHIVWHGMPYQSPAQQQEFFAQTHVGPDSHFANELPAFNAYLERVSDILKSGNTYTNLAVYLPNEDRWMAGEIPKLQRTPGAVAHWEMRDVRMPAEVEGFHPIWISHRFLKEAQYLNGKLAVGSNVFAGLFIDVTWLDWEALIEIRRLAKAGLPIVMRNEPKQPGHRRHWRFRRYLREVTRCPNVSRHLNEANITPLVSGELLPLYWARQTANEVNIFFAHPFAKSVKYPMWRGQFRDAVSEAREITVCHNGHATPLRLDFQPNQSLIVRCSNTGDAEVVDISYPDQAAG